MADKRARMRQERKTPVQPSQQSRKKKKPRKAPGTHYTARSYAQAIAKACEKANVEHRHPNQLRHTTATEIRKEFGLDAARAVLGHRSPQITEVDTGKSAQIMEKIG